MGARVTDSLLYAHLWGTDELRAVFEGRARVRAWIRIPGRTLPEVVQTLSLDANVRAKLRGVDLTGDMLDQAAAKTAGRRLSLAAGDTRLAEMLDPAAIVATRTLAGGAAPDVVRGMARGCVSAAAQVRQRAASTVGDLAAAEDALLTMAAETARE